MSWQNRILRQILIGITLTAVGPKVIADGKVLHGSKIKQEFRQGENQIVRRCLTPSLSEPITSQVTRRNPWSLPERSFSAASQRSVKILVLRFNFQFEETDDPNTTGRGWMDLSKDSAAFFNNNGGHFIDPPPHDSTYFDSHLKALGRYYDVVSDGRLALSWDIYPPGNDSVYQLAHPMAYYGPCIDNIPPEDQLDSIIAGLERYFVDGIRLVDSTESGLTFSDYESIFLFHAGADQQNNINNPNTCSDLFTGYIKFGDSIIAEDGTVFVSGIPVNGGADTVRTALLIPEAISQDNRATALNAVMAHEFGHQLGLPDLYRTGVFRTQLGDFALMDNNGFGTGIDFDGFLVGSTFGVNPVYPCAWSRAYLGWVDVAEFRQGSDIEIVAAEIISQGIKVARIPITDDEYFLIENRLVELDGKTTFILADSVTSVIQGPSDASRNLTREYDHLIPGSGVLIYHVDESVARGDFTGNGVNNFFSNQLQLDYKRRFIRIVEADGIVDLGGNYNRGFGSESDMYREDRNNALTPNSNPSSTDNTGNDTHISIINIRRDTVITGNLEPVVNDKIVRFDVETDGLVSGFPVRIGYQAAFLFSDTATGEIVATVISPRSPIVDDLDRDGQDEIIIVGDSTVSVFSLTGANFIHAVTGCSPCTTYYDNAYSRFDRRIYNFIDTALSYRDSTFPLPLYCAEPGFITSNPVTGDFGQTGSDKLLAVGYMNFSALDSGAVALHQVIDMDGDALADTLMTIPTKGWPIAVTFGDRLYIVTDSGRIYRKDSFDSSPATEFDLGVDSIYGICRFGDGLLVLTSTGQSHRLYEFSSSGDTLSIELSAEFTLGPTLVDIDRDGVFEAIVATEDGTLSLVTADISAGGMAMLKEAISRSNDIVFTTRPIAADIDIDGYPEIIIGGVNSLYAFDGLLLYKDDYPRQVNDRFPNDFVFASPVVADLESGELPEIIFPTLEGNMYSFGVGQTFGFPLSAGEFSYGSALIASDSSGAKLGFAGDDGWFYLWDFWASDFDSMSGHWLMEGSDPSGSFVFDQSKLTSPREISTLLPGEKYYGYPNPVTEGSTTIRYFLGKPAGSVDFDIYDLSGRRVTSFTGSGRQGVNEQIWLCGDLTPGVYRCIIEVDFGNEKEHAFTDIAIIR